MTSDRLQKTKELYHFGAFRLDAAERRLWCNSEPIPLMPKQFDLLFYFVENAGHVAKKSELLDAVWADTYIEEATLARNVSWLRNKLTECADGEPFIETVPKLGYRFTAKVEILDEEDTIIVEKQTVQYFRGEETITIDDETQGKEEKQEPRSQSVDLLPRRPSNTILFSVAVLVFVALAGIASFFYWNNTKTDAMPSELSSVAKIKIENIEIDVAREAVNSGINIQRGDLITFSVAGEIKYGNNQTRTFEGDKNVAVSNDYMFEKAAPGSLVGWIGAETDRNNYFQVSKVNSITADRNGSLYFAVNKPKDNSAENTGTLVADVTLNRSATKERPQIKIGSIVNLQNRYPNDGGYLDAWGMVWSKPEFKQLRTETMFVSTHYNPNRDNGSGSWEIVSATGKSNGEPLVVGDKIHLKNRFPNAGYLDACGWVEHLPVFKDFTDQTGLVFTTKSPDRDNGTGIWIVRSAVELDGSPVLEGDSIGIESSFSIDDKGKFRRGGFLNVAGNVKDLPAFNDYDGAALVFTQDRPSDQPVLDIWTITISKAVLK